MDKFTIIANGAENRRGKNQAVARKISDYLEKHRKVCVILPAGEKKEGQSYSYTDPERIPGGTECIIVLGGDGTLLQAARDVVDLEIPLFGINMGTLGYLAEIDQYSIYPALDRLMSDRFTIEKRMMLFGTLIHEGQAENSDIALNDIVISREGSLRVVRFNNYVNDTYLNTYKADGIIISTPTGSTGYSLSAGGPIISPAASMILMTPLAPHTLNTRSIVFAPEDVIEVELGEGKEGGIEKGMAYFDGAAAMPMVTGDRIRIEKSTKATRIIKINNISFLETLRKKMRNNYERTIMKIERHSQIIRLISQYDIETQEELAEKLNESGFQVTQATVSRDIRELKLTKISKPGGGSRYAVLQSVDQEMSRKYTDVLRTSFQSMDLAQNILVVKTVSGMAMAAAAALDEMQIPEIVGSIAGDNTLMCVARSVDEGLVLMEKIRKMIV